MKANEAPKKIYIHKSQYWGLMANEDNITKNGIEYTRTDAFIDKACEWLENHNDYQRVHDNGRGVRFDMTQCIIDFRKAMEG